MHELQRLRSLAVIAAVLLQIGARFDGYFVKFLRFFYHFSSFFLEISRKCVSYTSFKCQKYLHQQHNDRQNYTFQIYVVPELGANKQMLNKREREQHKTR